MRTRIYGRVEYAEPLTEVGISDAGGDPLSEFPGDWLELIAFPEREMHWIVQDGLELDE